jgi:hypothetical protein
MRDFTLIDRSRSRKQEIIHNMITTYIILIFFIVVCLSLESNVCLQYCNYDYIIVGNNNNMMQMNDAINLFFIARLLVFTYVLLFTRVVNQLIDYRFLVNLIDYFNYQFNYLKPTSISIGSCHWRPIEFVEICYI